MSKRFWIDNGEVIDNGLILGGSQVVVGILNAQDAKISDLQAKLTESENRNEQLVEALNGEVFINYKLPMENAKLKQQLAEMTEKYNACQEARKLEAEFHSQDKNELKQQLAEKEKENNELVFIIEEIEQFAWEQLNNENFDKYKAYDEMFTKIKQLTRQSPYERYNQSKTEFAIQQLQRVKKEIQEKQVFDVEGSEFAVVYEDDIDKIIEEIIKEIGGDNGDV